MSAETVTHPTVRAEERRRWFALAVIVTAQFMVVLDISIVNVALPSIKTDLHFSQESLQWVITAYSIFFGGFLLLGGRLADLLGRRRLFMAGVLLFTVSSLLNGLAWSEGSLIAFRGLQGLGAAMMSPAALSILTTTFEEGRDRNRALGIWGAVAGSGGAVGVLLGGVLTSAFSWPWIFFVNVPVGAAVIAASPLLLRESRADLPNRYFDFAGAATITAGLMLLVYGMTRATQHGWGTPETIGLLAASGVLIASFFLIESRSKAPLLPLRIFRLRTLAGSNLSALIATAAVFSQFFLLTLYMPAAPCGAEEASTTRRSRAGRMRAISCATKLPIEKPSRSTRWKSSASRKAMASWAMASTVFGVAPVVAATPTLSNATTRRSAARASMRAESQLSRLPRKCCSRTSGTSLSPTSR